MASTARQFLTATLISGSKRQMDGVGTATASNTKATQAALAVGTLLVQMTPEATTAAAATIPAAPATWNSIGWEMAAALDTFGDAGVTRAASVPVILSWTSSTAGSITFTVILFANGAEIGRGTLTAATTTAAAPYTVNVAVNAGVTLPASAKLQMSVYALLPANVGISAVTYTLSYGTSAATGTNVAPVTYTINASRSASNSTGTTDAAARAISITKTATDTYTVSTQTASRVSSDFRRSTSTDAAAVDTASRSVTAPRTGSESTATTDTTNRVSSDFRRAADADAAEVTTASRQVSAARTAFDSHPQLVAVESHSVTYGRQTREYFQPTDGPITLPTKRIQGTVYLRAGGAVYLGGATVTLVRDSDGLEVGTTVSSTVDGSYSFVRDQFDTNTYTTRIKREVVGGTVEEAISQNGLVPV